MAVGDKVRIDSGTVMFKTVGENIVVYAPVLGENGVPELDKHGCAKLKRMGGVKSGSVGIIAGGALKVHRGDLIEANTPEAMAAFGNDFVSVYPVDLEYYQQIGWFPIDHIKQFFDKGQ